MKQKLPLGQVLATPGVLAIEGCDVLSMSELLSRHASGDWGDLCEEDKRDNDFAVADGDRVLSAYRLGGEKVWIITEADRSSTTILLPCEY